MVKGRVTDRTAKALILGVGSLALGVLIGLVLGWYAVPIRWYDTDPSDLRLRHQMEYVTLVADSFALTGDVQRARQRLAELTDADTSWEQVANLVARVAVARRAEGDGLAAARLDALVANAGLPDPSLADFTAPRDRQAGPRVGLIVLGAAAFLFAAGALIWLLVGMGSRRPLMARLAADEKRERPVKKQSLPEKEIASAAEVETTEPPRREPAPLVEPATMRWETVPQVNVDEDDESADEALDVTELTADALVHVPVLDDDDGDDEDEREEAPPATSSPESRQEDAGDGEDAIAEQSLEPADADADDDEEAAESLVPEIPEDALGVFHAEYERGAEDFDCSFTIEDANGTFLGECGVGIRDVLDVEGDQLVNAFEIWLFDKADIRTVSAVTVSEYAYEDEVLYTRLSAKGELALAEDDLSLTLETQTLLLTATVTGFAYGKGGPGPNSHFERFQVELVVERNPAA